MAYRNSKDALPTLGAYLPMPFSLGRQPVNRRRKPSRIRLGRSLQLRAQPHLERAR